LADREPFGVGARESGVGDNRSSCDHASNGPAAFQRPVRPALSWPAVGADPLKSALQLLIPLPALRVPCFLCGGFSCLCGALSV